MGYILTPQLVVLASPSLLLKVCELVDWWMWEKEG